MAIGLLIQNLSVLSQQSVDHLRLICKNGVDNLKFDFNELKNEFFLSEIETNIQFDPDISLPHPEGQKQESNNDLVNCGLAKKALPNLKDIDATDERLWGCCQTNLTVSRLIPIFGK